MNTDNLGARLDFIEKLTGQHWLHEQVDLIRSSDPKLVINASSDRSGIHPLALAWFNAREELMYYELTGKAVFSNRTFYLAAIGRTLHDVSNLAGFSEQTKKLLDRSLFEKVIFAIFIAAGYAASGFHVEFNKSNLVLLLNDSIIKINIMVAGEKTKSYKEILDLFNENSIEVYSGNADLAYLSVFLDEVGLNVLVNDYKNNIESLAFTDLSYSALIITCKTNIGGLPHFNNSVLMSNNSIKLPKGFKIYVF